MNRFSQEGVGMAKGLGGVSVVCCGFLLAKHGVKSFRIV